MMENVFDMIIGNFLLIIAFIPVVVIVYMFLFRYEFEVTENFIAKVSIIIILWSLFQGDTLTAFLSLVALMVYRVKESARPEEKETDNKTEL